MTYILTYKLHGKHFTNVETVSGQYLPHQYEAAANGLLIGKIEQEGQSRKDRYNDLCLVEYDENTDMAGIVWTADEYYPVKSI